MVGQAVKNEDLIVNVCRTKHQTGHRNGPKSQAALLAPPRVLTLDDAIEYLSADELLEVTPESLRVRKKELDHTTRQRAQKNSKRD